VTLFMFFTVDLQISKLQKVLRADKIPVSDTIKTGIQILYRYSKIQLLLRLWSVSLEFESRAEDNSPLLHIIKK